MLRDIVKIDENLCDGCGECIPNCHEGALQIIDGKARLVNDLMCDGLGACIGHCPRGAISVEKREAGKYDEMAVISQMVKNGKETVFAHLEHLQEHGEKVYLAQALDYLKRSNQTLPFSMEEVLEKLQMNKGRTKLQQPVPGACPGQMALTFDPAGLKTEQEEKYSELSQWPVQLHLINPAASIFHGADLLVAADCTAFAYGDFHRKFIHGKKVVIACPKLDQGKEIYIQKFIRLINEAKINTIHVVVMEVPCCGGLIRMIQTSLANTGQNVPVKLSVISTRGEVIREERIQSQKIMSGPKNALK